jgi:hypothetical protein
MAHFWGVVQPVGHRTVKGIPMFFKVRQHRTTLQNQGFMRRRLGLVSVFLAWLVHFWYNGPGIFFQTTQVQFRSTMALKRKTC